MQHVFNVSELNKLPVPNDLFTVHFIHTANITVAFNEMKAGATVPAHHHLHETIDFVQEGTLEMTIGQETVTMKAGTVAHVPPHILHSARAITDCKVINFFYPAREDFKAEE